MPDGYVTCSLCNRIVQDDHVNSSGRCSECAGVRANDDDAADKGQDDD